LSTFQLELMTKRLLGGNEMRQFIAFQVSTQEVLSEKWQINFERRWRVGKFCVGSDRRWRKLCTQLCSVDHMLAKSSTSDSFGPICARDQPQLYNFIVSFCKYSAKEERTDIFTVDKQKFDSQNNYLHE